MHTDAGTAHTGSVSESVYWLLSFGLEGLVSWGSPFPVAHTLCRDSSLKDAYSCIHAAHSLLCSNIHY